MLDFIASPQNLFERFTSVLSFLLETSSFFPLSHSVLECVELLFSAQTLPVRGVFAPGFASEHIARNRNVIFDQCFLFIPFAEVCGCVFGVNFNEHDKILFPAGVSFFIGLHRSLWINSKACLIFFCLFSGSGAHVRDTLPESTPASANL